MQIAHIAPTKTLRDIFSSEDLYHLCLTQQVLQDRAYAAFYRTVATRSNSWVILDVDTFEQKESSTPTSIPELHDAIRAVRPDEVVLPDIWGGGMEENVELAAMAAERLLPLGVPYMAVPRGGTLAQYMECAAEMLRIKGVRTFGVYEKVFEDIGHTRTAVVKALRSRFPEIPVHLLGCRSDLSDISPYTRMKVRGMDTCKFVRWGEEMRVVQDVNSPPPYSGRGDGYFERTFSPLQIAFVKFNKEYWREYCKE